MTDYFVCFIIGFLTGLALWYYHDLKDNPYLRGFQDGYDWANIPEKEEKKVDAVPVIRCKDCKWFGKIGCAVNIVDESDEPEENDYCSWAERKDNGAD